ncbi:hypothetical protein V6N13_033748 [Hibiscus sabdariffa]|uniref:Uncharacterized protein n=1 Tax=Hibiscus sabdariffa TaxID=183260 RepID=A0ABR2F9N8_9ROSI
MSSRDQSPTLGLACRCFASSNCPDDWEQRDTPCSPDLLSPPRPSSRLYSREARRLTPDLVIVGWLSAGYQLGF